MVAVKRETIVAVHCGDPRVLVVGIYAAVHLAGDHVFCAWKYSPNRIRICFD